MLPKGQTLSKEVHLGLLEHVLVMHLADAHDSVLLCFANCNNMFVSDMKCDELDNIVNVLTLDNKVQLIESLKRSFKQSDIDQKEPECKVTFKFDHEEKQHTLPVVLKEVSSMEKAQYTKSLFFILAQQVSQQQNAMPDSEPRLKTLLSKFPHHSSNNKEKRKMSGMSIINPKSKRIHRTPGVQFDDI